MEILKDLDEAYAFAWKRRLRGRTIGLVPTMGALHQGHLSLVHASKKSCEDTVATIFVNPTQFAPGEDLAKYPRTLEADLESLQRAGADAVFLPDAESVYPPGLSTSIDPPAVASVLEGEHRPSHFAGVATIVLKLFHMVPASHAFFGQKDYQQFCVIESMVRDLNVPIHLVACPIVRETDGLAMSSRNRYLGDHERVRALTLSAALQVAEKSLIPEQTDFSQVEAQMRGVLDGNADNPGVDAVDYAVVVSPRTLRPVQTSDDGAIALVAARVGQTRLIDNRLLRSAN